MNRIELFLDLGLKFLLLNDLFSTLNIGHLKRYQQIELPHTRTPSHSSNSC